MYMACSREGGPRLIAILLAGRRLGATFARALSYRSACHFPWPAILGLTSNHYYMLHGHAHLSNPALAKLIPAVAPFFNTSQQPVLPATSPVMNLRAQLAVS